MFGWLINFNYELVIEIKSKHKKYSAAAMYNF